MGKKTLDAPRLNAFALDPNQCVIVGLDTDDGPEHPLYDEDRLKELEELDEAMVRNIQAHGVIQPITVRKNGDRPEVVAGRRRVVHAREAARRQAEAGEETVRIPATVKRGDDGHVLGLSRSENAIRRGDTALSKAKQTARLLDFGKTEEDAAVYFGVTVQTINAWLKLLDTAPEVQKAVQAGKLGATAAAKLSSLSRAEQKAKLAEMQAEGKPTTQKATVAAKQARGKTATSAPKKSDLKKVIKYADEIDPGELDFFDGLRFALGALPESDMTDILEAAQSVEQDKKKTE